MGNKETTEEDKEASILIEPKQGEASEFYWACREGDLIRVQQLANEIPLLNLNKLEPNGSTPLHASTFHGHGDVVRYLLHEKGVERHRKNRYGLTAYQECLNDQIRQIFHRPEDNERFYSKIEEENLFESTKNSIDNEEKVEETMNDEWLVVTEDPDDQFSNEWIDGSRSKDDLRFQTSLRHLLITVMTSRTPRILVRSLTNFFSQSNIRESFADDLQTFLDKSMPNDHPFYNEASRCILEYRRTKKVEHLIKLYTIECPFYKQLAYRDDNFLLFLPIVWDLDSLSNRFFKGKSYRGMQITPQCLRIYSWALEESNRMIITRSFCSSSKEESVARNFAQNSMNNKINENVLDVFIVMEFNDQCPTTIQLDDCQEDFDNLSFYPNEKEVLILPGTKFRVTSIEKTVDHLYVITLTNISLQFEHDLCLKILNSETLMKKIGEKMNRKDE